MKKCIWCKWPIIPIIHWKVFENETAYFHMNCWIKKENIFHKAMQAGDIKALEYIRKKIGKV